MAEPNCGGVARTLLYPTLFEAQPVDAVDRVLQVVVARAEGRTKDTYAAAVRAALASEEDLGRLLPGLAADPLVRAFLHTLLERLG